MTCGSCCSDHFGSGCCSCKTIVTVVALLTTLTTIAALLGVYNTHVTPEGWMFGTLNGSIAILAFLASAMCWLKLIRKMCPCSKGGTCAGCGHSPCRCK